MALVPYLESGADGRRLGGALMREEISSCYDSEDSDDDMFWDDPIRHNVSLWLAELDHTIDDVPELPPPFIVQCRDLLEKGWGWQRLVPYCRGLVDWTIFKGYLKDYFMQNAGEIAALCANKKPEKDKDYFCRKDILSRKKVYNRYAPNNILKVVADMCIEVENNFRYIHCQLLTAEDISLSHQIEERAKHMLQSAGEYCTAAAALVCIVKETDLLSELFDCAFDTTVMITLSKKIRQSAFNLMLYEGLGSDAAAGVMVGLAKEAKFLCYVLTREDGFMLRDYSCCHVIREGTAIALDMLLQESRSETSNDSDVSCASAGAVSENPQGTVGDLDCASDGGDVNGSSAGAKSEKSQSVFSTVGVLNCNVLDSVEQHKEDLMYRDAKVRLDNQQG